MDKINKLTELKKLLDDGLLTQEEFNRYKSELISGKTETHNAESNVNEKLKTENNSEENTNEQKVNNTSIKEEDKGEERKYTQELNSSQTNHSYARYILAILFFVGGGFFIFYHFALKDKWKNDDKIEGQYGDNYSNGKTRFTYLTEPVDNLESYSVTGISNEQELYSYLDEVATYWCSEFKKAKSYQNKNRRFEEMLKVDRCINAYPLGFQEGLIMLNDLPMELNSKATEHFQNKVKELGFDPDWNQDSNRENLGDLDDEIEKFENGQISDAEYNRQQEQAEYESSQAYYNNTQTNTKPDFNKPKTKSAILIPGQIITYLKNDIKYTVELNDENVIEVARFEPANRIDSEGFLVGERRYKMQDDCIVTEFASIKYIIKKEVLIVNDYHNTQTFDFQKSNFK